MTVHFLSLDGRDAIFKVHKVQFEQSYTIKKEYIF